MNRIYLDRASCEYFGVPYFEGNEWTCSKDAYKRVMGHKLDEAHHNTLANHRQIMILQRQESDGPGWYSIISSHA
jgi:hypothetical protein